MAMPSETARNPNDPLETQWAAAPARNGRVAVAVGAAAFFIMLPVTLIVPVLKELLADRYAASPFWTHGFMSINLVGAILAAPLTAWGCDRAASRARLIFIALLLNAAAFQAMAWAGRLDLLLLFRALEGVFHSLALTALMAMAADHAPPQFRGRAMGLVGACMMFGTAAGTRLGGWIGQQWPGGSFSAAALLAFWAALFVAAFVPETPQRGPARRLRDSLQILRRRPALAVPFAYTFIDRFCVGVIISSLVLFLATAHGISPDGRGKLLAMFLVPFALLVYPAGRLVDRIGSTLPLAGGSAAFGLLFATYGFTPTAWLPAVMVISGVFSALMFAPTLSLCADLSPTPQRGAAFAGFNAFGSLGFLCGPLVAGALHALFGARLGEANTYRLVFLVAGALQVLCVAVTLPRLLRLARSRNTAALETHVASSNFSPDTR